MPDNTLDPSLYDTDKVTASLGARFDLLKDKTLALATTYTQVFYFDRTVSPRGKADGAIESDLAAVGIREEARGPDSAGTYKHAVGVFNLNVEYMF